MKRINKPGAGRQMAVALVAGLMVIPALSFGATLPSAEPQGSLQAKVLHELRMLPYYGVFDDLGFTVSGDRVTLMGKVVNPVLKSDAENAVKHLTGVAAVDDQIQVLPLSSFDRDIRMRTYFAIYGYGPLQKYGVGAWPAIHIIVENGHVTLVGEVLSEADRNMAYIRANGVPGAFSVTNELRLEGHTS